MPEAERITHYFGDYGGHFFNDGVADSQIDAAYEKHLDHLVGSIEEGKLADFVVLAEDPFTVDLMKLSEIGIVATVVDDRLVYGGPDRS